MRHFLISLLSLIILFHTGCRHLTPQEDAVQTAYFYLSALHYRPDSALAIIDALGSYTNDCFGDSMKYVLARNLTLAANNRPVPLDTLTKYSITTHKLPTCERSAAFYTYGLALYHDGHPLQSLLSLRSALSIGERYEEILNLSYPFLVGDIHSAMAQILRELNDSTYATEHLAAADKAYKKYGSVKDNYPQHTPITLTHPADSTVAIENEAICIILRNLGNIAPDPNKELIAFQRNFIMWISFTALIITIIGTAIYIYFRNEIHRQNLDRDTRALQSLSAMMEHELNYSSNLSTENRRLRTANTENYALYEAFCSAFQVALSAPNERKRALTTLLEKLRSLLATPDAKSRIERHVNLSTGGILLKFREEFPEISDSDYIIFIYYATGFTARSISILLDLPINQIYNKKSYLRRRIRNSTSPSAAIFLAFLD